MKSSGILITFRDLHVIERFDQKAHGGDETGGSEDVDDSHDVVGKVSARL